MISKQSLKPSKKDQAILEQRKKLQERNNINITVRLQTESENTKLLKIQQKEREVETQYQNEKKNMEETLSKLSVEAQAFISKQMATTQEFQEQKEQIFTSDRKKEMYLRQKEDLQVRNAKRREQIEERLQRIRSKKQQLAAIRVNISKHHIYQEFLKDFRCLSEGPTDMEEFSVMSVLDRYRAMQKKKSQLAKEHQNIEEEKQTRLKSIQNIKRLKEEKLLNYSSKAKDLKEKIDSLNEASASMEEELEGKLNLNAERQREMGQIIFSIRGLYHSIAGEEKLRSTIQMLKVIQEERKKLREYLDLYQQKTRQS